MSGCSCSMYQHDDYYGVCYAYFICNCTDVDDSFLKLVISASNKNAYTETVSACDCLGESSNNTNSTNTHDQSGTNYLLCAATSHLFLALSVMNGFHRQCTAQ
jgi:hypothetical protein